MMLHPYTWVLVLQICSSGGACDGKSMTMGFQSKAHCEQVGRDQLRHPTKIDTGSVQIRGLKAVGFRCVPASEVD